MSNRKCSAGRRSVRFATLGVSCIWLLVVSLAYGDIYRWTDDSGKVHFTDSLANVPAAYRARAEQKISPSTTTPRPSTGPGASPRTPAMSRSPESSTVPLVQRGNAMLVPVLFNGAVTSVLIVDTGAELTVISRTLAQQLGLNLDRAAIIPLRSASGVFLAPLTKIASVTVGEVTARDVEVVVHDLSAGAGGLLGMSFLDGFAVTINSAERRLTLTSMDGVANAEVYGGRSKSWWIRKFRFYRRQIAELQATMRYRATPEFRQTLRYFQNELVALERRATLAAVPREWRY